LQEIRIKYLNKTHELAQCSIELPNPAGAGQAVQVCDATDDDSTNPAKHTNLYSTLKVSIQENQSTKNKIFNSLHLFDQQFKNKNSLTNSHNKIFFTKKMYRNRSYTET